MFLPQKLLRSCRQLAAGAAAKEAGNSDEVSGEAGTNPQHSIVICYLMDGAARGLLWGRRRSCSSSSRGLSCSCRGQRKQERFMKDTECVAPCSADDPSSRQPTIKVKACLGYEVFAPDPSARICCFVCDFGCKMEVDLHHCADVWACLFSVFKVALYWAILAAGLKELMLALAIPTCCRVLPKAITRVLLFRRHCKCMQNSTFSRAKQSSGIRSKV